MMETPITTPPSEWGDILTGITTLVAAITALIVTVMGLRQKRQEKKIDEVHTLVNSAQDAAVANATAQQVYTDSLTALLTKFGIPIPVKGAATSEALEAAVSDSTHDAVEKVMKEEPRE